MKTPANIEDWETSHVLNFLRTISMGPAEAEIVTKKVTNAAMTGAHLSRCIDADMAVKILGVSPETASSIAYRIKLLPAQKATPRPITFRAQTKISEHEIACLQREDGSWNLDGRLASSLGLSISRFYELSNQLAKIKRGKVPEEPTIQQEEERAVATWVALKVIQWKIGSKASSLKVNRSALSSGSSSSSSQILASTEAEEINVSKTTLEDLIEMNPQMGGRVGWEQYATEFLDQHPIPDFWHEALEDFFHFLKSPRDNKFCSSCKQEYSSNRMKCPHCVERSAPILLDRSAIVPEGAYRFDPIGAQPIDLSPFVDGSQGATMHPGFSKKIRWEGLKGVHRIAGGLASISGVFLIDTEEGVVVLKYGGLNCASEYYCSLIAPLFSLNVPKIIMISQNEFGEIKKHIEKAEFSREEEKAVFFVQKVLPVMLMEYVPGNVLAGLPHLKYLTDKRILKQMGNIIAFDLLVNNFDRLPLVWDNEGNPGNIIFTREEGQKQSEVFAIDQYLTGIKDGENAGTYLQRVREALQEAKEGKMGQGIKQVRESIKLNTGYELLDEECHSIQEGILEGVKNIVKALGHEHQSILGKIKEQTIESFHSKDYRNESEFALIDVPFMGKVMEVFLDFGVEE